MKSPENEFATDDAPKNALDRWIIKIGNLLSLLFIFTVAISFYEVLMRYVFNSPTTWVHETASFLGGSLFVIGGLYAFAMNRHVRVVLIYDHVSPRTRQYLNIVHHIVGLCFAGMMAYAAYIMASEAWFAPWGEFRLETSGSSLNPPYPALLKGIIFVALCVLTLQFILHLIAEIIGLRKRDHV
ncbi:TRAP transporter small permease subunit [Vibrio nigripulchritudo]|uniref:TRAP transporter small permease subunit n=1 Tax=Vibrio nigripulchritudo TaxID=28173 RepID=UPI0024910FD8|nr:TRAP transporter small permease subunit [Vibrio nigripulchritudo]BDU39985.1 tripartite transporter small subunit [Vibrio nigripulchritudo]BDU45709.1 tripartite transporter small subunit [Vibrio nigripulchritudo]